MNNCTFVGFVGNDAELSYTPSGASVLNFSVAVSVYGGKGADRKTLWVRCAVWGKQGEALQPHVTKGKCVAVSGEINMRTWTGQDGANHSSLDLSVRQFSFEGRKADGGGGAQPEPRDDGSQTRPIEDSDIPF